MRCGGDRGQRWRTRDGAAAAVRSAGYSARPHAAEDRREHGPRSQRGAARYRRVRGGFFRGRGAQVGDGGERREAQLHRLHRQSGGRGHVRGSGDQRPVGKGPHRYLADDRHRRRHRARRERAGRTGRERRRVAQPRADRRQARRPHPPRSRGQARRLEMSRAEASPSPTTGSPARCSPRRSSSTRGRRRSSASASSRSVPWCARSMARTRSSSGRWPM